MKKLLILAVLMGISFSACRPKPQVEEAPVPEQPVSIQSVEDVPRYTREEMMRMEEERLRQAEAPVETNSNCTPEAQQARAARMEELHQAMMKLTKPPERAALSSEYSALQDEEVACMQSGRR